MMLHLRRKTITAAVSVAAAAMLMTSCTTDSIATPADTQGANAEPIAVPSEIPVEAGPEVVVTRVVDGDTIVVRGGAGGDRTVRLIGVDTPETKKPGEPVDCFGPQASEYTSALLTGRTVRLESDPASGEVDRYDRQLAYVWRVDDQRLFNLALIEAGAAREYTYNNSDYRYRTEFRTAETAAQDQDFGLWGKCPTEAN